MRRQSKKEETQRIVAGVPGFEQRARKSELRERGCSKALRTSNDAASIGMSLMGRSFNVLPNIGDAPVSFTLSKDKSLPIGLLALMADAGHMRRIIPSIMPSGPEELLIKSFNLWLEPRTRRFHGWIDLDTTLSLTEDHLVLRLRPSNCGYFPAFDRYYASLAEKSSQLAHAFYSLLHHSLNALGYIYDLTAAQQLKERMDDMREEEMEYQKTVGGEENSLGEPEDEGFLKFDKMPESFSNPLSFAESLSVIADENHRSPSPILRSLLRLARASRKAIKPRPAFRWLDQPTDGVDSLNYEDEGDSLPLMILAFSEHSVIEQAFDEEAQYFGEVETAPLIRMLYKRGMSAKEVSSELALFRRWLHALTLTIALSRQIEKVQEPQKRYWN